MHNIPKPLRKNIFLSIFADDVAIWVIGENIQQITADIQTYLDTFLARYQDNKLLISPNKTIASLFQIFTKNYVPPRLFINNYHFDIKDHTCFLGLT